MIYDCNEFFLCNEFFFRSVISSIVESCSVNVSCPIFFHFSTKCRDFGLILKICLLKSIRLPYMGDKSDFCDCLLLTLSLSWCLLKG